MKKMAALTLAMIMGLSMIGCGAKDGEPTPPNSSGGDSTAASRQTETEAEAEPVSDENVELSVMHFFVEGDGRYELGKETFRKFKEAHPNINIAEEAIAHDLYVTQLSHQHIWCKA